jgi:hypothetical protein
MSALSSISTGDLTIFQPLQNLTSQQQSSSASGTTAANDGDGSTQGVPKEHRHHHGGGGGGSGFFANVQSAVTSALQSAQSSGSDSDPNQVIQTAIEQVLNGQQSGTGGTTGQTTSPTSGSGGSTGSSGSSARAAFEQLLQSNGVDPQQFQQDFQAAIHSTQSGDSADPSSVFASFPPGSAVNTTA